MYRVKIKELTESIYPRLLKIRRNIHQNPELGYEEYQTSELIARFLEELDIEYYHSAKTGIVGIIRGGQEGKTVAIRADMDALPITEENDVEYRSKNKGVMHACGHDVHTASLLGAAYVLSNMKEHIRGNVKLIFQPGEEGIGGAKPMIDEGALENPYVDCVIASHVMSHVPSGKVLVKHGAIMASPDDFELIIHGKGGHGAYPHKAIDPVSIACYVVTALQTLVSRYTNPLEPCVLTVGYIQAGTCTNVIPDNATIAGTVRTLNPDLREKIPSMIENLAGGIIKSMGADYEFSFHYLYPPTVNDKKITDLFAKSAAQMIGEENVIWGEEASMGGEDFAFFAKERPATFVHLGAGNPEKDCIYPIHNSRFNVDEACMKVIVSCFAQFVFNYLDGQA